jgi:hypothetical protein
VTEGKVTGVLGLHQFQVCLQFRNSGLGQHGHAVFGTFASAHCDLIGFKGDVFDAQRQALIDA